MTHPNELIPHQADKLMQTVGAGPMTVAAQEPAVRIPRPGAPWIAVSGGKGGVGKTTISVNLALLLQRSGHRVLLVDLDPGLPNVDVQLRLPVQFSLEDVAQGHTSAEDALLEGPHGLRVLAGRSGSDWLSGGGREAASLAIRTVERLSDQFDIVIVDTGAGIGPAVMAAAARADVVLGITTPDPASITDAYALCKVLLREGHGLPHLVINHVKSRDHALSTVARLGRVTEQFLGASVPHAGWLRRDVLVERSTVDQRALALHGTGPVMEDLRALAAGTLSALPQLPKRSGRGRTPAHAGRVQSETSNPTQEAIQASRRTDAARRLLRRRESN